MLVVGAAEPVPPGPALGFAAWFPDQALERTGATGRQRAGEALGVVDKEAQVAGCSGGAEGAQMWLRRAPAAAHARNGSGAAAWREVRRRAARVIALIGQARTARATACRW